MFLYHVITTDCNIACKYCFYQSGLLPKVATREFSPEKLYRSVAECGFTSVSVTGGEPLLDKRIERVLSAIKQHGLCCSLLTNGTLIRARHLRKFSKIGLDQIVISIDSNIQSLNDEVRGRFDDVTESLRLVTRISPDIRLCASIVLGHANIFYIPELIDFLGKIGVETAVFTLPATREGKIPFNISEREFDTIFHLVSKCEFVDNLKTSSFNLLKKAIFYDELPAGECAMGNSAFVINSDGSFLPCFHRGDLGIGNCYRENMKNLLDRWYDIKKAENRIMSCFKYNCLCIFAPIVIKLKKRI